VRRIVVLLSPFLALFLCVPWGFVSASDQRLFGLPVWAAFALGTALLFAALTATFLGRFWDLSASAGESDSDDDAAAR
jgi:hypothetical protein